MAQRRMFSKSITNSSNFLMMPQSSQNLYFHLGMNADDDGFCEHFSIMRMTDSKPDDLKVLQAKNYVNVFDDKVLVVTDWKENNYLRNDRYTPSKYLAIYKKELKTLAKNENGLSTNGIPDGNQMATQVRLGKDSIGKVREGKVTIAEASSADDIVEVIDSFKEVNISYSKWFGNKTQRSAIDRLLKLQPKGKILNVITMLPKTNKIAYFPNITTPIQLEDKWSSLENAYSKKKVELTEKSSSNKYQITKIH